MVTVLFFVRIEQPPRYTRPDKRFPDSTLFRSSTAGCSSASERMKSRSYSCLTFHDRISASKKFQCGLSRTVVPTRVLATISPFAVSVLNTSRSTRSEEHTSELQYIMRFSYAVFCLKKKK